MPIAGATLRLIRLETSLAGFLSLFLPMATRTQDVAASLLIAGPLLFISMCTFIANDLNDRERDQVNHPERPLPSGHITPSFAATLYFVCLAAALFTTRYWAREDIAFWYYLLIALSTSYGHVVDALPLVKAPYVAGVIAIPVIIVASNFGDSRLYGVASAAFLFNLGKELCADVLDRGGDRISLMHRLAPRRIAATALLLQAAAFIILVALSHIKFGVGLLPLVATGGLLGLSGYYLLGLNDLRRAISVMRVELLIGLYFVTVPSY